MIKVIYNKLLGGWYVVRGPHQTPISGRFASKAATQAWLQASPRTPGAGKKYSLNDGAGSILDAWRKL